MAYTKTIPLTEQQDLWLQNNLQQFKNEDWNPHFGQTSSIANQVLTLLETTIPTNET